MIVELFDILTLRGGYNTTVVTIASTLLGAGAGLIGSFALLRRRALMSDALAHATLPGICLAFIVGAVMGVDAKSLPLLLSGAAVTGVIAVLCVQLILRHTRLREDASIGISLSVFFGVGIVLQSYIQNMPGGDQGGLTSFIYGQTAAMRLRDALTMGGAALLAIAATALAWKELALVCFNEGFARAQGYRVAVIDLLMMALVVVVTVIGIQAVGLIMIIALLIIPPASARFWTERLWVMLAMALLIGALSGYIGAAISAVVPDAPSGSVIVLTSGGLFAVSMLIAPRRGLLARVARGTAMRVRMEIDHLLEAMHVSREGTLEGVLPEIARERGWGRVLRGVTVNACRWRGYIAGGELTERGHERGERVARNHSLWAQYLVTYADVAPSHVDWSVDQVEHVLSEELVRELEKLLEENVGTAGDVKT